MPNTFDPSSPEVKKLLAQLNGNAINWYMLQKLPSAYFIGVRVRSCSVEKSEVTVPFWWFSQNPFRSIYFVAQYAAAEFATGILAQLATMGKRDVSMLVVSTEGKFLKKAASKVVFTCTDGDLLIRAVEEARSTGESVEAVAHSQGTTEDGTVVSEMSFTWSFKLRSAHRVKK